MREVLRINGHLIDLPSKPITRKIQIASVGDIKSRKSSFSYSIKLPMTDNNIEVLDFLGVIGNTSRKPFERLEADYIVGGIPLISKGYVKISESGSYFKCNLFDGVIDLGEKLKGKKIADLPLSDMDHILTAQSFVDSFSNTSGYIYAIGNFGLGLSTDLKVETVAPSIYTHTIFRKIFEDAGLNLVGSVFDTNIDFLSEVITASKGYDLAESAFDSVSKGGIDTGNLSGLTQSSNFLQFETIHQISGNGLDGVTIVGNGLRVDVAGTYKLNVNTTYRSYKTYLTLRVKVNGENKALINLSESNIEFKDQFTEVTLVLNENDVVEFYLYGSSYYPSASGFDFFILNYNVESTVDLFLQEGGNLVRAVDYIGDMNQMDFVIDVVRRFGLILNPISNSSDYNFKRLEEVLSSVKNAEDWTEKASLFSGEKYISGYARKNSFEYNYPDSIVIPNNDGYLLTDNENAEDEKRIFTSSFEVPEFFRNFQGEPTYLIPIWELDDGSVKNVETDIKVMKLYRVDLNMNFSLFDEATSVNFNGAVPFLSLNNMSMQYFIDSYYRSFESLIDNYKQVTIYCNLDTLDIFNLDLFRLKYFKQTGKYYYVESVQYTPEKVSKVIAYEIFDFPENLPPSQIGDFDFEMSNNGTRIISLSNLLQDYFDPEGDEPKAIKIISGFSDDLSVLSNGIEYDDEFEIDVDNFDLSIVDNGIVQGDFSRQYTFSVSDLGSGQFSDDIGVINVSVISSTPTPPIADAGDDFTFTLPNVNFLVSVSVSGSGSTDNTGQIVSYLWSIESMPVNSQAVLYAQNEESPIATMGVPAMDVNSLGDYVFKLVVTDSSGLTDEDTVVVTIDN